MRKTNARLITAAIVTVVWAATYMAALFDPTFHAPPEVSTVMLVIVTYLFVAEDHYRRHNGNGR